MEKFHENGSPFTPERIHFIVASEELPWTHDTRILTQYQQTTRRESSSTKAKNMYDPATNRGRPRIVMSNGQLERSTNVEHYYDLRNTAVQRAYSSTVCMD
jgi:hypothetical protein